MLGIRFMKAAPTTYVLHYRDGGVKREGAGLSFFYFAPASSLALVPLASADAPFVFNEVTADFQQLTIQGQLTWRVAEPKRLAALVDFTVGPDGAYASEDPESLSDRLVRAAQVLARGMTQRLALREALGSSEALVREVLPALRKDPAVTMLGIEILEFSILSLKPTPEMARALEAEAREALQRRADGAIYDRRNAAVEQERRIKESELGTEIAVEEKRMALIDRRVENERKDADSRAYALEAVLKPVRGLDWRTLMAVASGGADPRLMIAVAFRELAENAGKIGELNVTPDLLKSLLSGGTK